MRFSVKSHSKLYFLLIFAITFYFLGDFAPFSSLDQHGIDLTAVYGQLDDDDENEKQGLNPNTTINSAIDGNNNGIANNGSTTSDTMKFSFSGRDGQGANIYRFECSMDAKPFVTCVSTNTVNVGDGTHTFSVRSEDNAGNKDSTPASFTWTVDTTPPMTSIISAIDGNNNTISDNGNSESTSIRFNFSGTDTGGAGVDHLECNIDNSKYVACTSPFVFLNILKDGIHTFNVRSIDRV